MRRSVAAVVYRGGKILVARRKEGGDLGLRWEFPGGKVESGEDDRQALIREFEEEFGVRIEPERLLGETTFAHRGRPRALAAWKAAVPEGQTFELREHSRIEWLDPGAIASLDLADSDRLLLPFIG